MFQYAFMIRALIAGIAIALSASLLGVNLVLNRNSLIGDGLSHVAFGSMAISIAFNQEPLFISLIVSIISAYFILRVSKSTMMSGDAMIGIISSSALAIGVVAIQLKGVSSDISSYMFGSILGVNQNDVIVSIIIALVVVIGFILSYQRLFAMTFDETFAKAVGQNTDLYHDLIAMPEESVSLLAILTAVVVVFGMRLMGALLISGLIIFPTITAMRLFKSFKSVTITAAILGVVNFVVGLISAAYLTTPTGASVIIVNLIALLMVNVIKLIWK